MPSPSSCGLSGCWRIRSRESWRFEAGPAGPTVTDQSPPSRCRASRRWREHFEQCAPGGETLTIVTNRAWSAIEHLTASTTGDLLIVSHFNPIRCILGRALGMTPAETLRLHIPNADPIVLSFNGSFRLVEGPELVAG